MNLTSIHTVLRVCLLLGTLCYFALILFLLKRKRLTVRYSIIWLLSGAVLLVFSIFPYTVLVLRDLLQMEMPVNVVFTLAIAFILLLLLSFSVIVSGFSEQLRRLTQEHALLEKRVRELEDALRAQNGQNTGAR